MKDLMRIKDAACEEVMKAAERGVTPGNAEIIYYMVEIIKGVMKIEKLEEELEGGYSQNGGSSEESGYSGRRSRNSRYSRDGDSYDSGESYRRRGEHYVRGHYSRDEGEDRMKNELRRLMEETDDPNVKESVKRIMKQMDD